MIAQLSLLFDVVLALLLVATIVYAGRLHKRLNLLRSSRDELLATVEAFLQATERAETAVRQLKEATRTNGNELQTVIQRARDIRDDLTSMVTQGDHLANRLESGAESASQSLRNRQVSSSGAPNTDAARDRTGNGVRDENVPGAPVSGAISERHRTASSALATDKAARAELARELAQDLGALSAAIESSQNIVAETALSKPSATKTAPEKSASVRSDAETPDSVTGVKGPSTPRSRAEQELLSALGRRS